MNQKLITLLLLVVACFAHAQTIQDPIQEMRKSGRVLYKWAFDINHDGLMDLLVGYKATAVEANEEKENLGPLYVESFIGFDVFIAVKGGGYCKSKYVDAGNGKREPGGISVDILRCYKGYIEEIKQYGIVTTEIVEVSPSSGQGLGVHKRQVYCYTVENGDHIKRHDLTPLFGYSENNLIYEKYLSEAKRTKIELQEVAPGKK